MKTITVSDDVYYKLEKLKGDRSFSELIDELIRANVSMRIEKILELGEYETGGEDELMAVVEKIRRDFKVRLF